MSRRTLRDPASLVEAGLVPRAALPALERVASRYAVAVTPAMADLIETPEDGIGRQFLPRAEELDAAPGERADPIGDAAHAPLPGIVHRYPDRVLLKPLHVCPVYCRFCFRREVVGPDGMGALSEAQLDAALAYVAARPEIWEVVVTGGDPFLLSPRRLERIGAALAATDHVRVLRLHTRVPAVEPERVDAALVAALKRFGRAVFVALHANHPGEFTPAARAAIARLVDAGIPLVSQSVLLRGVNDDPETLAALMRAFVENRVKPYYLHHGDLAPGTGHFRTSLPVGQALMRGLRGRVSGLCQPTYVLDIPGGHGKVPVGPAYLEPRPGGFTVTDPEGRAHAYPPEGDERCADSGDG
ncbi:lysine 2,3-aminomutase YodO family protein [Methylobacterium sp. 4-46]|uniref:lysine-2,3-aminomutase-like protein n=1 Tax=unclassified Methylobacterium TaxID=2615210 RepID=UPI000165C6C8|nr:MULTISPECIES: lysine-2,3-aminomutase-like protein [Methylobacterium]ACA14947.1 lysine 2,3-aminomutase YodO family protein [Methylobacterium sp. 4-46]WFT80685.1 lysine-2,3-aminomutase-like protein [Methylobacterium nodulans]